ncbi:hypothetical protein HYU07_04920 [Candidatus Woesearchaeota archaeon]|nr:hypothetical protein [Candidatus Woesearchaeota archaeon]
MTKTKKNLKEDLFNVKEANFVGPEYSNEKSLFFVDDPHKMITSLKNRIKECGLIEKLEKETKEKTGEYIGDIEELMEEGNGKIFLAYKGIFVLKKPKYDGDIPVAYPYNLDKKRALCFLLASHDKSCYLIKNDKPLVEELMQNMMAYLDLKRKKEKVPFADHRSCGTDLNRENHRAAKKFLGSYRILKRHTMEKGDDFEKFILMASLSAVYPDIMSVFSGNKEELDKYRMIENIRNINPEEKINGELKYWSESYFHSRFSQPGRFWQMIKQK